MPEMMTGAGTEGTGVSAALWSGGVAAAGGLETGKLATSVVRPEGRMGGSGSAAAISLSSCAPRGRIGGTGSEAICNCGSIFAGAV